MSIEQFRDNSEKIYDPIDYEDLQGLQGINRARWFNFLKARIGDVYKFESNKHGLIKIIIVDVFNGDNNMAYVKVKNQSNNIKDVPIDEFISMVINKKIKK